MRSQLEQNRVALVAISMDDVDAKRAGRSKHGGTFPLLADPDLAVTDAYNLRQNKAISAHGISSLPIPTTLLVDAGGTVRWMDQAEHYAVREMPERVLEAVRSLDA